MFISTSGILSVSRGLLSGQEELFPVVTFSDYGDGHLLRRTSTQHYHLLYVGVSIDQAVGNLVAGNI